MVRRTFLGGVVVLAAVMSAGCASSDPQPETTPRATPSTGADAPAPVVLVAGMDTPGAGDARISGTLVESSGCLAVEGPELTYPAVWPADTTWDGAGLTLPDGSSLRLGDPVDLGGSYARRLPEGVTPNPPDACATAEEFVVIDLG